MKSLKKMHKIVLQQTKLCLSCYYHQSFSVSQNYCFKLSDYEIISNLTISKSFAYQLNHLFLY